MEKLLALLLCASFLLVSCGKEVPEDDIGEGEGGQKCKLAARMRDHTIAVSPSQPIPAKIAIVLNGELKYDQCLDKPEIVPPAPVVTQITKDGKIQIRVIHLDAYPTLPDSFSLEILDRKDCQLPSAAFFQAADVPLKFEMVYPNGPGCGGEPTAHVDLPKNP